MKQRLRTLLLLFCAIAGMRGVRGQDIHFSQFDQSPFNLNPGLTGQYTGQYRVVGNQRTQWRSVTEPYRTLGLSVDGRQPMGLPVHTGLSFFTDQAGDSRLRTTLLNLSVAREVALSSDGRTVLVPGLMIGFTSMRIDYSALRFDAQWTGQVYDPSASSGENFPRSSRGYLNLHAGAVMRRSHASGRVVQGGLSFFNLSSPRQSFFDDGFVRLDPRVHLHANWLEPLGEEWQVQPSMLLMWQGTYREWDIGGNVHHVLSSRPYAFRSVYGGLFYRTRDAGFVVAGMRYDEWNVGLSYDINTSGLRTASNGRGGFEVSVIYILPPRPAAGTVRRICPDYL